MANLKIEIVKRADGGGLLRCTRADSSVTWQKQPDRYAAHFTHHDLTHFAVETVLGYRQGFFGLIANGWDIDDTTGKGKRGRLPAEAAEVESVVGLFETERGSGTLWTPAQFAEFAPRAMSRPLDETAIVGVRARRGELFRRWAEVPVGGTLELELGEEWAQRGRGQSEAHGAYSSTPHSRGAILMTCDSCHPTSRPLHPTKPDFPSTKSSDASD